MTQMDSARDTESDERLLRAFAAGDDAALAELARRYERSLLGLARGLLGGDDLAREATQDAWVRVIRFAGRFDGRSSFKTWVYRIVINQCRDIRRKTRRRGHEPRRQHSWPEPVQGTSHAAGATGQESCGGHGAAGLAERERQATLRDAVARLPNDRRTLILLCYHDGVSHADAAEILRIPLGTVKSRLHAALAELRAALTEREWP